MILFKHPEKQRELAKVDARLREILDFMERRAYNHSRDDLVITSIFRDQTGSVHKHWRGVDVALLEKGDSESLRRAVNRHFPYDPSRPKLETICDLRHGSAPHFHIQVRL